MILLGAADNADWLSMAILCPTAWGLLSGALALWLLIPGGSWNSRWARFVIGIVVICAGILLFAGHLLSSLVPGPWKSWDLLDANSAAVKITFWLVGAAMVGSGIVSSLNQDRRLATVCLTLSIAGAGVLVALRAAGILAMQPLGVVAALVFAAGMVGLYLAESPRKLGGVLALAAGALLAADLPWFAPIGGQIVFWLLALVTLGSGVAMISSKSPVYSALWFALSLVGSAGLFLMQGAQFLGGATIVVYAGAIVVTFLFVIMLAQPEGHAVYDRISWGWFPRPAAILAAAIFLGLLAAGMSSMKDQAETADVIATTEAAKSGDVLHPQHMANLGRQLFSQQLIAVEVAGTLLMAALVGAIAIAIHGKQSRISEGLARE